jgi:hypothetical protein
MDDKTQKLLEKMRIIFWIMTSGAIIFFIINIIVHYVIKVSVKPPGSLFYWGLALFILSVITGAALPVLMRTVFHSRAYKKKSAQFNDYAQHKQLVIVISLLASIPANCAYLFLVPKLYLYGSVLAGLYGIYAALPSERKITGELKYYGLEV